jgi:ribonuclease P protein component
VPAVSYNSGIIHLPASLSQVSTFFTKSLFAININMPADRKKYLTRTSQYNLVYSRGSSWGSPLLVMKALPNGLDYYRCGFVVSKRIGKAVVRNRVRRWLREVMRQTPVKPGWDVIFIARPGIVNSGFAELKVLVRGMFSRAKLLSENYERTCFSNN